MTEAEKEIRDEKSRAFGAGVMFGIIVLLAIFGLFCMAALIFKP
jgi:uncharacterized membrane protein YqjE